MAEGAIVIQTITLDLPLAIMTKGHVLAVDNAGRLKATLPIGLCVKPPMVPVLHAFLPHVSDLTLKSRTS